MNNKMTAPHILIVEDDEQINNVIANALQQENMNSTQAFSGSEGIIHIKQSHHDLIILDLMLPGLSGEDFMYELREEMESNIPVIILSAKDKLDHKLNLFRLGATDYVTKPFEIEELIARINVHLSKAHPDQATGVYTHKNLILNNETHEVTIKGHELNLTRQEYNIVKILLKNKSRVFSKQDLYELAWNDHYIGEDKTITVHISNIRAKIKEYDEESYIDTVWGIGFKLSS